MRKRLKGLVSIFLALVVLLAVIPGGAKAGGNPWDPYSQFIPHSTPEQKRHLRATWICTVVNMDWPLKETSKIVNDSERIQKSKDELIAVLDRAAAMNLNAVFFQVSPEGDAFYKSNIVPWSRYLTGTFGKDPGFDPLAFAIEEARKRNLEMHAWFNPYRVSVDIRETTVASLNIGKSVYKEHPDWIRTANGRFVADPGIPEARKWVEDRVMEVVANYDIDGVHFDDYFYYEKFEGEMKDQDTYKKYNNGKFSNIGDWRRNNTYTLVKELSQKIRAAKPWVKFGISPSGVWGNKKEHADGSNTNTSYTNYERCFADTKKWVQEELIDYIAPQIYFSFGNTRAPYGELASWWSRIVRGKKVHLYIGQALYKVNADSDQYFKGDNGPAELGRQTKFNIAKPEVSGSIMFRMNNFNEPDKQNTVAVIGDIWKTKALVPVMPWKGGRAPEVIQQGKMEESQNGLRLIWKDKNPDTAYFAVYRFNKGEKADISNDSIASKLIGLVRKGTAQEYTFTDSGASDPNTVFYVVSSLDRLHNENSGRIFSITRSKYFPDVGDDYSWAVKAVDSFFEKGIITGDGKGRFNPGKSTTRADFIYMLVRALDLKAEYKDNFSDIPKSSYTYEPVGIAKEMGIIKGDGKNFFPDRSITREDMMVIILRAIEASGRTSEKAEDGYLSQFSDSKNISGYAREAVASMVKSGFVQGAGGAIMPKKLATKAELVVIIDRLLNTR